jgi:hypothetical protein
MSLTPQLVEVVKASSPWSLLVVLLSAPTLLATVVVAVLGRRTTALPSMIALGLSGLVVVLGLVGHQVGSSATQRALRNVPTDQQDTLLYRGTVEARAVWTLALPLAAAPLLMTGAVLWFGRRRFASANWRIAVVMLAVVGIGWFVGAVQRFHSVEVPTALRDRAGQSWVN